MSYIDSKGERWIEVDSDKSQAVGKLRVRVSSIAAVAPLALDNRTDINKVPEYRQRAAIYTVGGNMLITASTEDEVWEQIRD